MPFHYALAYLAVVLVPIMVGIAVVIAARRQRVPMWTTLFIVPVGMLLSFVLSVMLAARCADSYDVIRAARTLLSPAERETLRGAGWFCPKVYHFERDGKGTCLVSDGDGAAFVGCG